MKKRDADLSVIWFKGDQQMSQIFLHVFAILCIISEVSTQLLGAGTGFGSCRDFPYRGDKVNWEVCPGGASCGNEFGYCRTKVSLVDNFFV